MKNLWIRNSAILIAAVAGFGVAGAQTSTPSGVSARLGVFLPSDSLAADRGTDWLAFGVDYKLSNVAAPSMTMRSGTGTFFSLSGDYYSKGDFRAIPVVANYNVRAQQLIFTGGIGADFQRVLDVNTIGMSVQFGITYEFSNGGRTTTSTSAPFFLQAKYFLSSNSALDGLGLFAGMRF